MDREYLEDMLWTLVKPLETHFSKDNAGICVGHTAAHYENSAVELETFARPLWGLVPCWAGGKDRDGFADRYRKGIIAGTDPEHSEYWGACRDFDQKFVEMAAVAYALLEAPAVIWEPMTCKQRENLAAWLFQINEHQYPDNNWHFFLVIVNVALKKLSMPYSEERMNRALERIEDFYKGKGWYQDGDRGYPDYYIGWAFHFYGLLYAKHMESDERRCKAYKERAGEFAKDFIYWFSEEGAAIPYGRSLTYRFAQGTFFSMCIAAGLEVLPMAVMKGIVMRLMSYWGVAPICDTGKTLTIGYLYPNLQMAEIYNSPGSPYWALKVFACLSLPADHPFWKLPTQELPYMESRKEMANGQQIVQKRKQNTVLFVPGMFYDSPHGHEEDKYSKFAYSTQYGFSIAKSQRYLTEMAPDSMLVFYVFGQYFCKSVIEEYEMLHQGMRIKWKPLQGIEVESTIAVTEEGHVRTHVIHSIYECTAYDCGFAVRTDEREGFEAGEIEGRAYVRNAQGYCEVHARVGNGKGMALKVSPNTNILVPKTHIPMVEYAIKTDRNNIETEVIYG